MDLDVLLAVHRSLEHLLAVGAHEGALLAVHGQVARQTAFGGEGQSAQFASVGLDAGVRAQMRLKHALRHERLATLEALVGLLARVRAHVLFQVTRLLEGAVAVLTAVRPIQALLGRIRLELVLRLRLHESRLRDDDGLLQRDVGQRQTLLCRATRFARRTRRLRDVIAEVRLDVRLAVTGSAETFITVRTRERSGSCFKIK